MRSVLTVVLLLLVARVGHAQSADEADALGYADTDTAVDPDSIDLAGCEPTDEGASIRAPTVRDVVKHAVAVAGFDRDPASGWRRRARLAGLVPALGVRAGRNTRWEAYDPGVGYGTAYEVRATWRLDRLVFDGRELQAASLAAARRRDRERLASRVIRLYFAWRHAELRAGPCALLAEQAAAELDALTADWFTTATALGP